MSRTEKTIVQVFAKAPIPGAVKTRLMPRLGAIGAARLHENLVRHALRMACDAKLGEVVLYCAPDCDHPFFIRCAGEFGVTLRAQSAGNLGDRMHDALEQGLRDATRVLLMGTDCPVLGAAQLQAAAAALTTGIDLVFVPVGDGGYVLIGARAIDRLAFDGVGWGGATVMQQARDRLMGLGWSWNEQPTLWDVDRLEDLDRLAQSEFRGLVPTTEAA
jgi:rSAM/selenodomain-associated transferase 1